MSARKNGTAAAVAPLLDRASILLVGSKVEIVAVSELGGAVRVRELTAGDLLSLPEGAKNGGMMIVRSLIGADDQRLFADDDVDAIMALPSRAVTKLIGAIMKLNFQTKAAAEDLAKN